MLVILLPFIGWLRIPHHAPGRLVEGVACPSASGRDPSAPKTKIYNLETGE